MTTFPRTWTADIVVYDRKARTTTTINATDSEYDLLRDQTNVAVNEAALLGVVPCYANHTDDYDVTVVLWKRTKARGLERDRSFKPFIDRRGVLRFDGPYS